jgi:hypothetical protein
MVRILIYITVLAFSIVASYGSTSFREDDANKVVEEMILEIGICNNIYYQLILTQEKELLNINDLLNKSTDKNQKLDFLISKDRIKSEMKKLYIDNATDISRIRYLKGLQIIRILYEKVLSLDHHFASVRTFSEINKMANPNQYPEFEKMKALIKSKKDKKSGMDLTSVLGTNTIVSVVNTFSNMLISGLSKEEKEAELKNIECILDFTLRMQGDLNTIYFETAYLQKSNEKIKGDIEVLFKDYTKPIEYNTALEQCRSTDDWEAVRKKMSDYLAKLNTAKGIEQNKMYINIEFPIDRLMQFITQYNSFIDQGAKFYEKFKIILNSYENQQQCDTKLPLEYKKLKSDIDVAIDKFNIAYKPVEINGSKMKEILYGINEYD